jgi:hypothetical protein
VANPEATEAAVERQELCNERLNGHTIRSLTDRYVDQHRVVRRQRLLMERTQGNCRSRKNVTASRSRKIRHAVPAMRKVNIRKGSDRDNLARKTPKGWTPVETRRRTQWGEQRRHREWALETTVVSEKQKGTLRLRQATLGLEVEKRVVELFDGIRGVRAGLIWKVQPHPKRKEKSLAA